MIQQLLLRVNEVKSVCICVHVCMYEYIWYDDKCRFALVYGACVRLQQITVPVEHSCGKAKLTVGRL